jgi:hypothetical protein
MRGKQVFSWLRDKRIWIYPRDWTGELRPDLVVFPCERPWEFSDLQVELPQAVRARVASGEARVVLDASTEALAANEVNVEALHGFLRRVNAPIARAVYVTQHRQYAQDYGDYCASRRVPQGMTILHHDYWIKRMVRLYRREGQAEFERRLEVFRARSRTRSRRFLSLNRSPRPAKILFLMRMLNDGLFDRGHVSFGGFQLLSRMGMGGSGRLLQATRELAGFGDMFDELEPRLDQLSRMPPVEFVLEGDDLIHKASDSWTGAVALAEYGDSWFSVVTETEMLARPVRVTEKVFKPLLNFHPLLVFGNPGSLKVLRDFGFETFPEIFDEAYDDVAEPRRRFDLAYAQLERLCGMDEAELERLDANLAEKLEFNARRAFCELPELYRAKYDRPLVGSLVRAAVESVADRRSHINVKTAPSGASKSNSDVVRVARAARGPPETPDVELLDFNQAPADEAVVYGLTRRGLCSEINWLLIGIAYALATRRHFYLDDRWFVPGWSSLFDVRFRNARDMPTGYRDVIAISSKEARPRFNEMVDWAGENRNKRIRAAELGFDGTLDELFVHLAGRVFRPTSGIRRLAEEALPQVPFVAVHIRRGDKIAGPESGGSRNGPEGEDHAFEVFTERLRKIAPEIRDVFLMTDDYQAFLDAQGKGYVVRTLCPPDERGYFQDDHHNKTFKERRQALSRFIAEMLIATRSVAFGGTYKSNVGRLVYALHPHKELCFSVDEMIDWSPV